MMKSASDGMRGGQCEVIGKQKKAEEKQNRLGIDETGRSEVRGGELVRFENVFVVLQQCLSKGRRRRPGSGLHMISLSS